jgi:hypothetical protein
MNDFDAYVMKPVFKEVIFIGKVFASIKIKIINHNPEQFTLRWQIDYAG